MRTEELTALLRAVRDRVRARHPESGATPLAIPLLDLMPLAHARDAAEAKVAAIGSVNPRKGGPLNWVVQTAKRLVSRALDWHVRDQVQFNRDALVCLSAAIDALDGVNRSFHEIGIRFGELRAEAKRLESEAQELKDVRNHWSAWRLDWERKLAHNEMQFLRSVADLQATFQHRVTLLESSYHDQLLAQHAAFTGALERGGTEIQQRLWADLERARLEYEHIIHSELRVLRQRFALAPQPASPPPVSPPSLAFDYGHFAEKFRGPEEYVREGQRFYVPWFAGRGPVLDIGCGRGEFLELMREAGVPARGIDLNPESIAICRAKGLHAEEADLFAYLDDLADASLDGIFCAQVVEHLPPQRLPEFIRLAAAKTRRGGVLVLETPNPECLAIFAVHFYLDPTHSRPIPHPLLTFYMEEFGYGKLEVHKRAPAVESMPPVAELPEGFREAFFGGLDYAAIGRKL